MRRPDVIAPTGLAGRVGAEKQEVGSLGAKNSTGSVVELACQCRFNQSGCLVCRRWDRVIRQIEIRRADAIRRQWYSHQLAVGH